VGLALVALVAFILTLRRRQGRAASGTAASGAGAPANGTQSPPLMMGSGVSPNGHGPGGGSFSRSYGSSGLTPNGSNAYAQPQFSAYDAGAAGAGVAAGGGGAMMYRNTAWNQSSIETQVAQQHNASFPSEHATTPPTSVSGAAGERAGGTAPSSWPSRIMSPMLSISDQATLPSYVTPPSTNASSRFGLMARNGESMEQRLMSPPPLPPPMYFSGRAQVG
jgi:hypothetical protein